MNKRILVIDDDRAIRQSFILALDDTDYIVETAESGEAGLQMINENTYNLVMLDLKMPGMDGIQTLIELRKVNKELMVYIVTAFHEEFFERLQKAQQDGLSFGILRKPLGSTQILSIVKGLLDDSIVTIEKDC